MRNIQINGVNGKLLGPALVDDSDYLRLIKYRWHSDSRGYCYRHNGFGKTPVSMHREVVGAKPGQIVDHKNGNPRDVQRSNLRLATFSQNSINRRTAVPPRSGYRGVSQAASGRWVVKLRSEGSLYYIGTFDTPAEAARQYNEAAIRIQGEFAVLNEVAA